MFSNRFADKIAGAARRFLQHTCTLQSYVPGSEDEDGTYESYTDIECLLLWKDVENTDNRGTITTKVPVIYFNNSVVVTESSIVQNVRTRNSVTILDSAKVTTVDSTAEGGNAALKVCTLEGATL